MAGGIILFIIFIVVICKFVSGSVAEDQRKQDIDKMVLGQDGKGVLGIIEEMNKDK